MNVDILLKGGLVIDPANGVCEKRDVAVKGGKIVDVPKDAQAEREFNAEGYLVTPGLIDNHAHVFKPGADFDVNADSTCIPQGVTALVDAGSAGSVTYDNFHRISVTGSHTRIYALLHVSRLGMLTLRKHADLDPANFDLEEMKEVCSRYKGEIVGIKCMMSKSIVEDLGLKPLEVAVQYGEELGLPVVVHVTDPAVTMDKIADVLRKGDILCHCYHGTGDTIIGSDGKVLPGIWKARERGVLFDSASGKSHLNFPVTKAALAEGFVPDIISTDITTLSHYVYQAIGLPFLMSMFLNLGLDLKDVVEKCTVAPAKWMGIAKEQGTLAPGTVGDIAVFKLLENRPTKFLDTQRNEFVGDKLLIPQLTIFKGKVAYRNLEFNTEA